MSLVSVHALSRLPVYTKMGTFVGRVVDVELDDEQMVLVNILVQSRGVVGLLKKPFVVGRSQIIEISQKQVTVEDTVIPSGAEAEPA